MLKKTANALTGEMANKMYYKLLVLRFLPEIKAIEKGKLKALRGKEISRFLANLGLSRQPIQPGFSGKQ